MNKKIKYIILSIIVLACCYLYAHVDKTHDIYNSEIDSSMYIAAVLNNNQSVSQAFVCPEEHLDGVTVKVSVNSALPDRKLVYTVCDTKGQELAVGEMPFQKIKSGRINKIMFEDSIQNSKLKEYVITFRPSGLKDGENVGIYYTPENENNSGLLVEQEETEGTMVLRTITHRFDIETFIVVLGFVIYFVLFFRILYKLFS